MWGTVLVCVIVVAATGVPRLFVKAQVTGDTSEDRVASVMRLADDQPRGYADAIAAAAQNDPDPDVRRAALACLKRSARSEDQVVAMAGTQDKDPRVRQAAGRTLMTYPDEAAVARLAELCRKDDDAQVRQTAFVALAGNKSPEALVTLMNIMENEQSDEIRLNAARAMADKLNMPWEPDLEDKETWDIKIAGLKMSRPVQEAFEATNTVLVHDEALEREIAETHIHSEGLEGEVHVQPGGAD